MSNASVYLNSIVAVALSVCVPMTAVAESAAPSYAPPRIAQVLETIDEDRYAGPGRAAARSSRDGRSDRSGRASRAASGGAAAGAGSPMWLLVGGLALGAGLAFAGGGSDAAPAGAGPGTSLPGSGPRSALGFRTDFETPEYRGNYGLGMINASSRYASGGTGAGTLLSVFDTGADLSHIDLAPNVAFTQSYFGTGPIVTDHGGHGTHVASIVAGAKNGVGTHGVAFDARLAIFQGVGWSDELALVAGTRDVVADAHRQSIDLGAAAINHSWVFIDGDNERLITDFDRTEVEAYLGSNLLNALAASVNADMITVFAAGNDDKSEPAVMAGLPVLLPELSTHWLGVASVGPDGSIASSSNRCGSAMNFCLVAPGNGIYGALSSDEVNAPNSFGPRSGTSMAAPHVTGAVGVLKSNFPELTGAEISSILRDTAQDLGDPGVDPVYGHGLLDLSNAVAPAGDLTIMSGSSLDGGAEPLARSWIAGEASMSSSLTRSLAGVPVMVADRYMRGYSADMGDMVARPSSTGEAMTAGFAAFTSASLRPGDDAPIRFTPGGVSGEDARDWVQPAAFGSAHAGLVEGPHLELSSTTPTGRLTFKNAVAGDRSGYTAVEVTHRFAGGHGVEVELGHLRETGAMLGTAITGAFGSGLAATTQFARLGGAVALDAATSLTLSGSLGSTRFVSSGVLARGDDIGSSALGIGLRRTGAFVRGDTLTFGISRPLGITGGTMIIDAPVRFAAAQNGVRSSSVYRDISAIALEPSAAITDLQVGYSRDIGATRVSLGGVWRPVSPSGTSLALAAGLALRF